MSVQRAGRSDVPTIAETLSSAFEEDPVFSWIIPNALVRRARLRRFFAAWSSVDMRRGDPEVYLSGDGSGAAIWKPPGRWKVTSAEMIAAAPSVIMSLRGRALAALRGFTNVEKLHPREEHYYLEMLGTRRDRQSHGVGSELIGNFLEARCDAEGLPAYLESSNWKNVPFYRRHGFEVMREFEFAPGGPSLWAMWRDPKG